MLLADLTYSHQTLFVMLTRTIQMSPIMSDMNCQAQKYASQVARTIIPNTQGGIRERVLGGTSLDQLIERKKVMQELE